MSHGGASNTGRDRPAVHGSPFSNHLAWRQRVNMEHASNLQS